MESVAKAFYICQQNLEHLIQKQQMFSGFDLLLQKGVLVNYYCKASVQQLLLSLLTKKKEKETKRIFEKKGPVLGVGQIR